MPKRRALTEAQLTNLLALPTAEPDLVRHWTLSDADLAAIGRRRRDRNRIGFALQLCVLRYPGRLLRPGELIPAEALRFFAEQLGASPDALTTYAAWFQTRYEQLNALREAFGFRMYASGHGRELLAWLLPVALATTNAVTVAAALMDELRRRRIIAPGLGVVERLVAASLVVAERHVAGQLTRGLFPAQTEALDALLATQEGSPLSVLAWARQPPGAPGHKALKGVVEQLTRLRAVGLDPACAEGVHPERLRKLAREGGRFTAQHLRALSLLRRRATLVATVLDTTARLTDDGVGLFDRAVGRMFRRAEAREENAILRDARVANDKVRLFAKLGAALIAARRAVLTWTAPWRPPSVGRSLRRAWPRPRPSAWPARTRWISRLWPHVPGPCCIGSARCSSTPSSSAPCRPPRRRCALLNCCTAPTAAAAGHGRKACRPASSSQPGAMPCWTAEPTGFSHQKLCRPGLLAQA